MKKHLSLAIAIAVIFAVSGCSKLRNMRDRVGLSDVKKVADLIDMDFGGGPNGPFQVSRTTSADPKLVVQNDTDRTITVKAQGPVAKTFTVPSRQNQWAMVKSGSYHFTASAPGVRGCEGNVSLSGFNQYKWIFVIRR